MARRRFAVGSRGKVLLTRDRVSTYLQKVKGLVAVFLWRGERPGRCDARRREPPAVGDSIAECGLRIGGVNRSHPCVLPPGEGGLCAAGRGVIANLDRASCITKLLRLGRCPGRAP